MKKLFLSLLIPFSIFAMNNEQLTQRKNRQDANKKRSLKTLSMNRENRRIKYTECCWSKRMDECLICMAAPCAMLFAGCVMGLMAGLQNYQQNHSHSD